MEIKKPAMAGTLESSDCQVTVEPGNGSVEFNLKRCDQSVRQPDPQGSPSDTGEPGRKGCKNFSGGQGRAGLYH